VSASPDARTGLSPRLKGAGYCRSFGFNDIVAAQDRMIEKRRLVRVEMGPPSKRVVYLRLPDMRLPSEKDGEAL
jgi:hypothetical protein